MAAALNPEAPEFYFNPQPFRTSTQHHLVWNDIPIGSSTICYNPQLPYSYNPSPYQQYMSPTPPQPPYNYVYQHCNFLFLGHPTTTLKQTLFSDFYPHPSPTHQSPTDPPRPSKPHLLLQEKVDHEFDENIKKPAPAISAAAGDDDHVAADQETKPADHQVVPAIDINPKFSTTLKGLFFSRADQGRRGHDKIWVQKKYRSFESAGGGGGAAAGKTTLMIRHIPVKYTQEMLMQLLDKHCIAENEKLTSDKEQPKTDHMMSAYDFIYLPIDFRTKCNKGYAFVNFTNVVGACRLRRVLEGYKWEVHGSKKICHITYARIQGREALKKHFESSTFPSGTEPYLPVFFNMYRNGSCGFEFFTVGIIFNPSEKLISK